MFSTYASNPAKKFDILPSNLFATDLCSLLMQHSIKLRGTLNFFLFFKGILDNYIFSLSSVFATLVVLCYVGLMHVSAKQLNIFS
jgi:hypothetical protein